MIFLKMIDDHVKAYSTLEEAEQMLQVYDDQMIYPPTKPYDLVVSEEDWEKANYTAYIQNGRIILGENPIDQRDICEDNIRSRRKLLLRPCDHISPMFWEELTEEQRDECRKYRQALLDITDQPGFPWDGDVTRAPWPTPPEIMKGLMKERDLIALLHE